MKSRLTRTSSCRTFPEPPPHCVRRQPPPWSPVGRRSRLSPSVVGQPRWRLAAALKSQPPTAHVAPAFKARCWSQLRGWRTPPINVVCVSERQRRPTTTKAPCRHSRIARYPLSSPARSGSTQRAARAQLRNQHERVEQVLVARSHVLASFFGKAQRAKPMFRRNAVRRSRSSAPRSARDENAPTPSSTCSSSSASGWKNRP